jgi:membrane associated rhomboid family serine protease
MGFLIARSFYTKQPLALVWSAVVLLWFGGCVLAGLTPQAGISWAGHFWGFVGGGLAAKYLPDKRK